MLNTAHQQSGGRRFGLPPSLLVGVSGWRACLRPVLHAASRSAVLESFASSLSLPPLLQFACPSWHAVAPGSRVAHRRCCPLGQRAPRHLGPFGAPVVFSASLGVDLYIEATSRPSRVTKSCAQSLSIAVRRLPMYNNCGSNEPHRFANCRLSRRHRLDASLRKDADVRENAAGKTRS